VVRDGRAGRAGRRAAEASGGCEVRSSGVAGGREVATRWMRLVGTMASAVESGRQERRDAPGDALLLDVLCRALSGVDSLWCAVRLARRWRLQDGGPAVEGAGCRA
jgi:hypothetical protein